MWCLMYGETKEQAIVIRGQEQEDQAEVLYLSRHRIQFWEVRGIIQWIFHSILHMIFQTVIPSKQGHS